MRLRALAPAVWIVDDDADAREEFARAAAACAAEPLAFADGSAWRRGFDPHRAGCVLVDGHLRAPSAAELLKDFHACGCRSPVIVAIARPDVAAAVALMRAGAFDVFVKPIAPDDLTSIIAAALASDGARRAAVQADEDMRLRLADLTRREREVVGLVVSGLTSRSIAARLHICERTVEIYRSRIKKKLHTRNAADLVRRVNLARGEVLPQPGNGAG
ncbi:MAG: LuxR C-terminal-related transcriptional regulator [Planctomycetota bacterium]